MNNEKIAVVLPAYNSGEMLDRQISSILIQEGVSFELYLMDDHSSDQTKEKINKYAEKYENIHVVEADRNHQTASQSFFFLLISLLDELSNFAYIALSDHDDVWLPYKLKRSIGVLKESNASCYSSDFLSLGYHKNFGLSSPYISKKSGKQTRYDHYFEGPGPGCTFLFKNHFYKELVNFIAADDKRPYLDNVYAHDWFIYMYAKENNHKWIIDNSPHILYLQHENNETGVNVGYQAYKKRLNLLLFGWYLQQIRNMVNIISPQSNIKMRLNRMSIGDRLFFLLRLPMLRRRPFHAFVLGFFFCFTSKAKKEKIAAQF